MLYVDSNEQEKSFKDLYNKYYDPIYNYIFHQVLNKENAEDITSIVFLNAYNNIKKKNPKIENFHAWIYKVATNEVLQFKKNDKKKKNLSVEDSYIQIENFTDESSEKNVETYSDFVILNSELDNMNFTEKTLITLHFFEKKNYSEISAIMNIKENTLRPMMSRILKKLYFKLKGKI